MEMKRAERGTTDEQQKTGSEMMREWIEQDEKELEGLQKAGTVERKGIEMMRGWMEQEEKETRGAVHQGKGLHGNCLLSI